MINLILGISMIYLRNNMKTMKQKKLNELKKLLKKTEVWKKEISDRRDKLRDSYKDIESICESLDRADIDINNGLRSLESGIEAISEYI